MKVALTDGQRGAMAELMKFRDFAEAQYQKALEAHRYAMQLAEFHIKGRMQEIKLELGIPDATPVTFHWHDFTFDVGESDAGSADNAESI